jgi:predicted nucleotidyltransferase
VGAAAIFIAIERFRHLHSSARQTMIPDHWAARILLWAAGEPRVAAVYLFGSRAKAKHRDDSDIDLAVVLTEDSDDTAAGYAVFEGDRMRRALARLLPRPVDLQFAFPDDKVVWPAVQEHGVLLYEPGAKK